MKETRQRRRSARRRPAFAATAAAVALLAAAAPAAHVVTSGPIVFLSRDHHVVESQPAAFSTFEPTTMLILL